MRTIRDWKPGVATMIFALAAALPCEASEFRDREVAEAGDDPPELALFLEPAMEAVRLGSKPAAIAVLEQRFPTLRYAGRSPAGLHRFVLAGIAPEDHARLRAAARAVGASAAAIQPSKAVRAAKHREKVAQRFGHGDVVGFMVTYRDAHAKRASRDNERLEPRREQRLQDVTGHKVAGSRPMSGEAFAVRLERRVDLHEGELALGRLRMDPEVESAELDVIDRALLTPNDPRFPMQWNLSNPTAGIRATQAWDLTTGSANTVVAVVDTGELLHPEFASRLLQGADMITDPARARDGTARDNDPTDAGDFKTAGLCAAGDPADDSSWHGTFVMGIIGATGNDGQGIAGIDWRARLIQVRVLGRCGGTRSDILDGLRWAVGIAVPGVATNANPARVVNMSLGGPGSCDTAEAYQLAIIDALVRRATVVVAAGNENESALASVPASCVGAITVAATGPTGDKAFYSNYSRAIEIAAPGGDSTRGLQVWSTSATGLQGTPGNATYKEEQGTSFAAPHVAGVVSLMLGVAPSLTVAQVRDTVIASSSAFPAGSSCAALGDCGAGIVNAFEAVRLATALGAQPYNLSALWWQPTENGWGINFQQQGNVIFGTWFTYDLAGRDLWLVMPSMTRVTEDFFLGDVFETTGVPFDQINGQPSARTVTKVGTAVLAFLGITEGIFAFDISGTSGGHAIERQVFSTQAICTFTTGSRTALTNYQDLWWNPAETGWGVNITHQGNTIFATWFTYAPDGEAMWLVGPSLTRAGAAYTGELYRATGVPFSQINGAAAIRTLTSVGTMTLTFQNGEQGRMDYVVNGTNGSKQITRQVFSSPLSTCR